MKIDRIIKSNCSDWDYEVGSDEEEEDEEFTDEQIAKMHEQLAKEIKEEEWDADSNRNQSKL